MTSCVSNRITRAQNDVILAEVDEKEVKEALFDMHPNKSPGLDGMSPGLYQKCWNIMKKDVVSIMQ